MGFHPRMLMLIVTLFVMFFCLDATTKNTTFDKNYYVTWGKDRILFFKHGQEVQLSLDQSSGYSFNINWIFSRIHFTMSTIITIFL